MDLKLNKHFRWLALIILLVSARLYFVHRQLDYNGPYKKNGDYGTISPVIHDVIKASFCEFFFLLVYGSQLSNDLDYKEDWMYAKGIQAIVWGIAYFIFHELVQPYILAKILQKH